MWQQFMKLSCSINIFYVHISHPLSSLSTNQMVGMKGSKSLSKPRFKNFIVSILCKRIFYPCFNAKKNQLDFLLSNSTKTAETHRLSTVLRAPQLLPREPTVTISGLIQPNLCLKWNFAVQMDCILSCVIQLCS